MTSPHVRIAVVDEERFFRDAICEILTSAGFACVPAEDGPAALDVATDESVGVMVLDVRLAGSKADNQSNNQSNNKSNNKSNSKSNDKSNNKSNDNELDVLRDLRAARPDLRVLVLSASTDQETVLEALRLGACDYLAKPLHDEELVLAVGRAVEVHLLSARQRRQSAQLARLATQCDALSRHAQDEQGEARESYLRQAAAHGAAELLGAEKTSLMLMSDAGDELRVVAAVTPGMASEEMDSVAVGQGVAGVVFERGEGLLRKRGQPDHPLPLDPVPGRYEADSFVVVPVRSGDQCFGVLCATEPIAAEGFRQEDLSLLELFAGRLSELLRSGRDRKDLTGLPRVEEDFGAERGAVGEQGTGRGGASVAAESGGAGNDAELDTELIRQICEALVNDVEPERVIRAILRPIAQELGAAPVSLHLLDAESGRLVCEGQLDGGSRVDRALSDVSHGLTGTVLKTGCLVATLTPELDPRFEPKVDTPEDGRPGPFLCIPLSLRGQVVGVCRIFLPEGARASARTAEALAAALSAAVRNVLLYRSLVESIEEIAEARRQARS